MNKPTEQELVNDVYWAMSEVMVALQRLEFLHPDIYEKLKMTQFTIRPADVSSWKELRDFMNRTIQK